MEDWRQASDIAEAQVAGEDPKKWSPDTHHLHGQSIDTLEHWNPPELAPHPASGFEDPDTFIRAVTEPTMTLIEKETCAEDVLKVWTEISKFIVDKMKEGYGVKIAGLGTFSYFLDKIKAPPPTQKCQGQKLLKDIRRFPLFALSEFVVRMYDLISPINESFCTIPTISLNVNVIAEKIKLSRKQVDGIITEVLGAFSRAIVCDKNLEFPFPNIGKLQITNRKVVFKFYGEFCTQLDFYGGLPNAVQEQFVIPGAMTPLRRHIPTNDFRSVFHLREVRSVHHLDLLRPLEMPKVEKLPPKTPSRVISTDNNPQPPPPTRPTTSTKSSRNKQQQSVHTIVEDPSKVSKFSADQLYGPLLRKRCTISWIKGKRNYLNPGPEPWPSHRFHVVDSSVVLRPPGDPEMDSTTTTNQGGTPLAGNFEYQNLYTPISTGGGTIPLEELPDARLLEPSVEESSVISEGLAPEESQRSSHSEK